MTVEKTYSDNEPYSTVSHINNCAFNSWHSKFRSIVPKCKILEVPTSFVDYLHEDGIRVPDDGYEWNNVDEDTKLDESDNEDKSQENDNEEKERDPSEKFKEFHQLVNQSIQSLGGAVTPKLNWSAPKDATWISTTNNLKCVTASDIYMLLKASSYITHDLTQAYSECADYDSEKSTPEKVSLILRQWFEIVPALEFRCFVKDNHLVAICQRDMNYYSFLDSMKSNIKKKILEFFHKSLENQFSESQFVFDVYVTRQTNQVWLIDINPFARKTDSLLFSWPQILSMPIPDNDEDVELRLLDKLDSSRGFSAREHTENYVPADFVSMASKEEVLNTIRNMESMRLSQKNEDSSDEKDDEEEEE